MKRIEDQSGFQWAAQVLREGSRNEKENFSLAEAPATGRKRKPLSLAEAPATGRTLFSLAEDPDTGRKPLFAGGVSGLLITGRTLLSLAEAPATGRKRKPLSLEVQPDTDKYGCVPIPMPMSPYSIPMPMFPYPGLHARSLNLPPKPDAHIPVPIRPDTHAR